MAVEEEDYEKAVNLKKDFLDRKIKLIVPSLCLWEINNFICRKFPKEAITHFFHFLLLNIKEAPLGISTANIAFQISESCPGVTFYDASYHALAMETGGTYLTADKKYYQAVKKKKWGNIELLKNYK